MKMNTGSFVANGSAVNVDVGFIPDFVIAFEGLEEGTWQAHYWNRERIDAASAVGQFGLLEAAGTHSVHAAAVNGFAPYDTTTPKVMLPNPNGSDVDLAATLPLAWTQARSSAASARSTTALGTVIKPTSGNENGLIFECTNDATGGATEPTWPTKVGDSVTDGTVVWIARESKIKDVGVKGFTLGATGQTDSDQWQWIAFAADKVSPDKDMDNVDFA